MQKSVPDLLSDEVKPLVRVSVVVSLLVALSKLIFNSVSAGNVLPCIYLNCRLKAYIRDMHFITNPLCLISIFFIWSYFSMKLPSFLICCHSLSLIPSLPVTFPIQQVPSLLFSFPHPDCSSLSTHLFPLPSSALHLPGFPRPPSHLHLIPSSAPQWPTFIVPFADLHSGHVLCTFAFKPPAPEPACKPIYTL